MIVHCYVDGKEIGTHELSRDELLQFATDEKARIRVGHAFYRSGSSIDSPEKGPDHYYEEVRPDPSYEPYDGDETPSPGRGLYGVRLAKGKQHTGSEAQ